jgi:hypothetical protein
MRNEQTGVIKSVTHVAGQFCYLCPRLLRRADLFEVWCAPSRERIQLRGGELTNAEALPRPLSDPEIVLRLLVQPALRRGIEGDG